MGKVAAVVVFGIIVIALISIPMYITTQDKRFSIMPANEDLSHVVVLAIQPGPASNHHDPDKIKNGTLFLFMKNRNKLFYLPSFEQLASFSKKKDFINSKSPIYRFLFIGRYHAEDHTVKFLSLAQAQIKTLHFFKEPLTSKQKIRLKNSLKDLVHKDAFSKLNAAEICIQLHSNKDIHLHVGHRMYKQSLLKSIILKKDDKEDLIKQLNQDATIRAPKRDIPSKNTLNTAFETPAIS